MSGKVYFVSAPGRIKIGFTRFPERRLVILRRDDMEELTVVAIIDGERNLEKKLHNLLKDHRLKGEWFADCPAVRQVIEEAVAGKHNIAEPPPSPAILPPEYEPPTSPEFQVMALLSDQANAALDRQADKYEVRGFVQAFLVAAEALLEKHKHLLPLDDDDDINQQWNGLH